MGDKIGITNQTIIKLKQKLEMLGNVVMGSNNYGLYYYSPSSPYSYEVIRLIQHGKIYKNKVKYKHVDIYDNFIVCLTYSPEKREVYIRGKKQSLTVGLSYCERYYDDELPEVLLIRSRRKLQLLNYLGVKRDLGDIADGLVTRKLTELRLLPHQTSTGKRCVKITAREGTLHILNTLYTLNILDLNKAED